jgi:hypothetical protein
MRIEAAFPLADLNSSGLSGARSQELPMNLKAIPILLRGEPEPINGSIQRCTLRRILLYFGVIFAGAGVFGAAVGCWRGPVQAVYTAIKLPLILLLTTLGNALLNGMLAPLLGLNIGFRQSLVAILMSFTIAATILGSFSPILFFLVWNTPSLSQAASQSGSAYSLILVAQVLMIAFAGAAANLRLVQLLRRLSGSAQVARKILFGWLTFNLLLGAQLSWNLRPFVGSPGLPLQFLRDNAFQGNFFETLAGAARDLLLP